MGQNYLIPGAIVLAGGLIAFGVFSSNGSGAVVDTNSGHDNAEQMAGADVAYAAEREEGNHIFGDPNAPITIVEFSDYECPFCARLHPTLEKIVSESNGTINWEYRHLPIPSHRNAEEAAISSECVSSLAGNDAFWSFTKSIFDNQRSVNTNFFETEAAKLGVSTDELRTCVNDPKNKTVVVDDVNVARAFGGSGTPFSVIVYADGTTRPVSGALPYENWQALLGN